MKTLKSIFLCLLSSAFCLLQANAQIVYTDVIPDSTITCPLACTATYNLDLNNDGTNDFVLQKHSSVKIIHCTPCNATTIRYNSTISIEPLTNNAVGLNGIALVQNYLIGSSGQSWSDSLHVLSNTLWGNGHCWGTACVASSVSNTGPWFNTFDKYLAVRIDVASNIYYGWIKLSVTAASSFTVKEYAYNTIPNQPIFAGDTSTISTGIVHNELQSKFLSVYPNPATNSVTIKFPSDETGEISIVNLFGQIVYSEKINTAQTNIDASKFSPGMYVVRWNSGVNNETKTFSIIK